MTMQESVRSDILEKIAQNGVVGAGGAGFPTHIKLSCSAEILIANGAECEPLLHKDKELVTHEISFILEGLRLAAAVTGAKKCIIALKKKAHAAIQACRLAIGIDSSIFLHLLNDTYPAGDEFVLVQETTGRIPRPGGLPIQAGVVVQNIETLWWLGKRQPVTDKLVTIAGAVPEPITVWTPIGTPVRVLLQHAGISNCGTLSILSGGVMMGQILKNLDEPVTKTVGGLIVLPSDHALIRRYTRSSTQMRHIGKSACDQCCYCTQLCPRYLLGHPIEPHLIMRHNMMAGLKSAIPAGARYCCSCNLCSFWSCPEDLDPASITTQKRTELLSQSKSAPLPETKLHPMALFRKPTLTALKRRLGLAGYKDSAPLQSTPVSVKFVRIPLKQHVGDKARPCIKIGMRVARGQLIAAMPDKSQGAAVHASIDGTVTAIAETIDIQGD